MKEKRRSPKFPFVSIAELIPHLPALRELKNNNNLNRESAMKVLGFESRSGSAWRTIAALHAYHFVERGEDGIEITSLGNSLADNPEAHEALQTAALSPLVFRSIWRNARHASEEELTRLLEGRGFTEEGASRAATVYRENADLAGLDDLTVEPVDLPERPGPRGRKQGHRKATRAMEKKLHRRQLDRAKREKALDNALRLPLKSGSVIIPKDISESEFQLIIDTIHSWKDQLVVSD